MSRFLLSLMLLTLLRQAAPGAEISVDAGKITNKLSPWLYGACAEDVNHEIYGGLYDQRLYGESFEEAPLPGGIVGWTSYGGIWSVRGDELHGAAGDGGKIVLDQPQFLDGSFAFDLRVHGDGGSNAGAIVRVQHAMDGADSFNGYEISLAGDGRRIVLSRHEQNFTPLADAPVSVAASDWQHLRVDLSGPRIRVFLNADSNPAIDFTDPNPLPAGSVGLRTWRADAEFRNLSVDTGARKLTCGLVEKKSASVSGMWDAVQTGSAVAEFYLDIAQPFNGRQSQRIRQLGGNGTAGVANRGLNRWGVAVQKGHAYSGSVYLRGDAFKGSVNVSLQSADGSKTYASQDLSNIPDQWTKFPFTLASDSTDPNARFAITINSPGTVWLDQAVLMGPPEERFHNLAVRGDIGGKMQEEGLTFVRYGGTAVNAPEYRWVNMIGDRNLRPPYQGHWHPHTSNGFGIEDFVAFCNSAGFTPAFAIDTEETPEDMANMVEYLNGPATSKWGRRRAEAGHPAPYGVKFIEIGNEEVIWGDIAADYDHYIERFKLLSDAMKKADPNLQFINAAWWRGDNPNCERVFKALEGRAAYWDFHTDADAANSGTRVDQTLTEAKALFQKWVPGSKMKVVIFEENGNHNDLERALGHATTMNAVRKHSDFVMVDCAANALQPWQQNDNGWDQGQVFFTADKAWGVPPFYATQMASANHLPLVVQARTGDPYLDVSATRSEDGRSLCLHVVNLGNDAADTKVKLSDFGDVKHAAKTWTLEGNFGDTNTPDSPEKIKPVEKPISNASGDFAYTFPPRSYTILRFER